MTVPLNLRAERLRRGLSAAALARELGISADVVLYAERDPNRRPAPENALKIATFFGVDVLDQWPLEDRNAA